MAWSELLVSTKTVRQSSENLDIVELIIDDHKPLKDLIEVMKDDDEALDERRRAAEEFAIYLVAHAKPEESVLYEQMKSKPDLRAEAFEALTEHELADLVLEEMKRAPNDDVLSAKIKVVAELVEHHIEEEEDEILPEVKKTFDRRALEKMGARFLEEKIKILEQGGDDAPHEREMH
jgi:hemerythrin-like domain-containing protein